MNITLYKGCKLNKRYNDGYNTLTALTTYLRTLEQTEYIISNTYFTLEGTFTVSGSPKPFNYGMAIADWSDDKPNLQFAFFIESYEYLNNVTRYHYVLDVWTTYYTIGNTSSVTSSQYIAKYGSDWCIKNAHRVMCMTNRDDTCYYIQKPIIKDFEIETIDFNYPWQSAQQGLDGVSSYIENKKFTGVICGYVYSGVTDAGKISEATPFCSIMGFGYADSSSEVRYGYDNTVSVPCFLSYDTCLQALQWLVTQLSAISFTDTKGTKYYVYVTSYQIVPTLFANQVCGYNNQFGTSVGSEVIQLLQTQLKGYDYVTSSSSILERDYITFIGAFYDYIGLTQDMVLQSADEETKYFDLNLYNNGVAIYNFGLVGHIMSVPYYVNYCDLTAKIIMGLDGLEVLLNYNGQIIDITESFTFALNYAPENAMSAYNRKISKFIAEEENTAYNKQYRLKQLSESINIASNAVQGGLNVVNENYGGAVSNISNVAQSTVSMLSNKIDRDKTNAIYAYERSIVYSEIQSNSASTSLTIANGLVIYTGTVINANEISSFITNFGYGCDIFENAITVETNTNGTDMVCYDRVEIVGLPYDVSKILEEILKGGIRVWT